LGELVGSNASVSLMGPGGDAAVEIEANQIRRGDVDSTQYFAVADVTDIITSIGPGQYLVGNVQSVEVQGSYAGWSLVIITRDEILPRRSMTVTTPFSWFSPDDVYAANIAVPVALGSWRTSTSSLSRVIAASFLSGWPLVARC
jgi:hypothetical protein